MDQPIDSLAMSMMSADVNHVAEQISYCIWGAIATSSKSFGKVTLNIHPDTNRIFASVELRWWAKYKRLEPFRRFWLKRAESSAKEYIPNGWRLLVYYAKESNDGSDPLDLRSKSEDSDNPSNRLGSRDGGIGQRAETTRSRVEEPGRGNDVEGKWPFSKGRRE